MKIKIRKVRKYRNGERIFYGSFFTVKKAPIWKGRTGEVVGVWKGKDGTTQIMGVMDNGFQGHWEKSTLNFKRT